MRSPRYGRYMLYMYYVTWTGFQLLKWQLKVVQGHRLQWHRPRVELGVFWGLCHQQQFRCGILFFSIFHRRSPVFVESGGACAMAQWQNGQSESEQTRRHRRGNDFSVGGEKIGEKQSRQSNSKYSLTLCNRYFSKKGGVWGVVQSPRSWGIFWNFCVKNNLTVCKDTFNWKLQKKMGSRKFYLLPIILLKEQPLPLFPRLWIPGYNFCNKIFKSSVGVWTQTPLCVCHWL